MLSKPISNDLPSEEPSLCISKCGWHDTEQSIITIEDRSHWFNQRNLVNYKITCLVAYIKLMEWFNEVRYVEVMYLLTFIQ